jgi:hypothetical protein
MKIEHDFTRPNQPDDPGVIYDATSINHLRHAIYCMVAIAVIALGALAYTFTVDAYPVLKKTDRMVICGEGV